MRPLHPIPLPSKRQQSAIEESPPKSKIEPGATKEKEKWTFKSTRARYTVIDQARYGAVHVRTGKGRPGEELLFGRIGIGVETGVAEEQMVGDHDVDMAAEVSSTILSGEARQESSIV
jgi:hypothetical protein